MYFTDLTNKELDLFHTMVNARDMSVSLTDMLNSKLFKVIDYNNGLFKIFPLFYCKEIRCDNSAVRIMENKCIITPDLEGLYFNFITEDSDIIMFEDTSNAFKNGDHISTEDFNAYVQMVRTFVSFKDNINVHENIVTGRYANYRFNLSDVSIVDNGILITEETLSANPTVRLLDPLFENSTYTLKLDVLSVSDVNIYGMEGNVSHETLTIPLKINQDVNIDLGELDFNKIVLFDAVVEITHDQPVITYTKHLDLTVNGELKVGETILLNAYYDDSGTKISGASLTFYDGETVIGTATTDDEGKATLKFVPLENKEYSFNVACLEDNMKSTSEPSIVEKQSTNITLNTDKSTAYIPTSFTVSGVLTNTTKNTPIGNGSVKLYDSNQLIGTIDTNSSGEFSTTIWVLSEHNYQLRAVYDGNESVSSVSSNYVVVSARKLNISLTSKVDKTSIEPGTTVTFTGTLKDELGNNYENDVILMNGDTILGSDTAENGQYSISYTFENIGTYNNLKVICNGDSRHNSASTKVSTIVCAKQKIGVILSGSYSIR